jgi:hypothetical protein
MGTTNWVFPAASVSVLTARHGLGAVAKPYARAVNSSIPGHALLAVGTIRWLYRIRRRLWRFGHATTVASRILGGVEAGIHHMQNLVRRS